MVVFHGGVPLWFSTMVIHGAELLCANVCQGVQRSTKLVIHGGVSRCAMVCFNHGGDPRWRSTLLFHGAV